MGYSRDDLTKAMRWEIAEQLAEDRLEQINKSLDDVKDKDSFIQDMEKGYWIYFIANSDN